jgi:hypothetical protein
MGYFMPHVLAHILRREIIVRDLTNNCDFVNIFEPYPAIDRPQLRDPVFLEFCDNHNDALLPVHVESEDEPQNGIWEKAPPRNSSRPNKPAQRAASALSLYSPNNFGVLSNNKKEVSNSDSGKENFAMVSPKTLHFFSFFF